MNVEQLAKTAFYLAVLGAIVVIGSTVVERLSQQVK